MDDIATLQRPPPYPYRSRSSSVALPSYRAQRRHDEQTLVLQPLEPRSSPNRYVHSSQSMTLDLGRRHPGVSIPAYGNSAIVQGTLMVKDFNHVTDIAFTITGKASYSILECGYPILQLSKTVLQHSSPLWSCSQSHPSRDTPTTFPISFPLPTYARWSSSLLPPTTRFTRGNFKLTISYQVSIQLTRRGRLRRDERIVTEFAYAPRTIPDVGPSIGNSFRIDTTNTTGMDENKPSGAVRWKAANLQPLTAVDDPLPILLYIPSPTSYPSGTSIPFRIVIPSPHVLGSLSPRSLFKSPDTLSVELVKLMSLRIGKTPVVIEWPIGCGVVSKVEQRDGQGDWEATGCIRDTRKGAEASWSLGSFVECSYVVRTTVNLPFTFHASAASLLPTPDRPSTFAPLSLARSTSGHTSSKNTQTLITYRHDEPIHLCTDEVEAFEVEADDAWERPAVSLLPSAGLSTQQTGLSSKGKQLLRRVRSRLTSAL